ncbi:MAG: hypothetical protein WD185_07005, partial [Sneathiella sp.]
RSEPGESGSVINIYYQSYYKIRVGMPCPASIAPFSDRAGQPELAHRRPEYLIYIVNARKNYALCQ